MAVALPLTPDPVEALATGFRLPRRELAARLAGLREEGVLLGFWGEPNPALAGTETRFGGTGVLRWAGRLESGELLESRTDLNAGANTTVFLKAGTPPIVEEGDALLHPDQDRTCQIEQFPLPRQPLQAVEERMAAALSVPLSFDGGTDLWEQAGSAAGCTAGEAVMVIRRLVVNRHWRRLAAKLNLGRAGWLGCGVARWEMDTATARQAGAALAALRCTGDVWIEEGALAGLFIARREDEGRKAAAEVARQWGRPVARWDSLMLEQ